MRPKKPPAAIQVSFEGGGVFPEEIPLTTLSRALAAVQRLASGEPLTDNEDGDNTLSLVTIRRGSAHFDCAAKTPARATANLRLTGELLDEPENADQIAYAFNPLDDLSQIAKSLQCRIHLRLAGDDDSVLATIEPDTFARLSKSLLLEGDTTISGKVERVGGTTGMKCSLRVGFQHRLLYCDVATPDLVRRLGERLYEDVAVSGTARWVRNSWKVVKFTIKEIEQLKTGSILEGLVALRDAGGAAWSKVRNPTEFLRELSGD